MDHPARPHARQAGRRAASLLAALAVLSGLLSASAAPVAAATYPTDASMILQGVPWQDLRANRYGICNGAFSHVIKNVNSGATLSSTTNYLEEARKCGLKVIFHFANTINGGTVYPSRVARWVNHVEQHSALAGYLTVKEPSWIGINASEIRSLYRAHKTADPTHPVWALFGDIPHFGDSANPYTAGMADITMVDWYPIETSNGGCSSSGRVYLTTTTKWYAKVKRVVAAKTPGTPVQVMVQTHKNLNPRCHKKQVPTKSLLFRQVREAFGSAGAQGIAFHVWTNGGYQLDQLRYPTMVTWMKELSGQVRAGTFT